jgi:uncharacterized protein CbrC (UPF0167 family)
MKCSMKGNFILKRIFDPLMSGLPLCTVLLLLAFMPGCAILINQQKAPGDITGGGSLLSSWQDSLPVEFQSAQALASTSAIAPAVAVSPNGNFALITWQQSDGSRNQIFKSSFDGTSWTHPSSLSDNISPDGQDAYNPQVAVSDDGSLAVIIWRQSDGSRNQIFKSSFDGALWTHPSSLSDNISPDGQHAYEPQVAVSDDGSLAVITWRQSDGSRNQIFKSTHSGGSWTHPSSLSDNISPDGQHAYEPQVAVSADGSLAVIIWRQFDDSQSQIFKSTLSGGSWTHPSSLSDNISPDGQHAYEPQVAVSDDGSLAVITWRQSDGSQSQIFKSTLSGASWTHPSSLSDNISPDGQDASTPQVAVSADGSLAVITWRQSDGSRNQIFKSTLSGASWTHPSSLSDNISADGQHAYSPQVAVSADGSLAVITWRQSDGSQNQIFKSSFDGALWTHPSSLSDNISPDGQHAYEPQVAVSDDGSLAVITWRQSDGSQNQIFKSSFDGASWTHPSSLSDNISPDGQDAYSPQVAVSDDGSLAVITWRQSDGSQSQIFKSSFDGTSWTHPSSLSDNISPDGQHAYEPQVAVSADGSLAVIIWRQFDDSQSQIFKSTLSGGSWTHPSSLSDNISPDGQDAYSPQVTVSDDGSLAVITWEQSDGSQSQIFKSSFDGTLWTHPSSLSDNISPDGQDAQGPQVAMSADGSLAVITWEQSDGSQSQIFKSSFDGASWTHPSSLSDNISPNGQDAHSPQVAVSADSSLAVITWFQTDGSQIQIFKSTFDGASWTHPSSLSDNISPDGQHASTPQVAVSADGSLAVITWRQSDGSRNQIFKSTLSGGSWTHPSSLSDNISPDGQHAYGPHVEVSENGRNAMIAWLNAEHKLHAFSMVDGTWETAAEEIATQGSINSFDLSLGYFSPTRGSINRTEPLIVYGTNTSIETETGIRILYKD